MLGTILSAFSLEQAFELVMPLGLFVLGMVFYSFLIFKAYLFISKRDIFEEYDEYKRFKTNLGSEGFFSNAINFIVKLFEYVFLFPFVTFFFFIFFFMLIVFLSKSADINHVLLISMAIIGAIRVTSYLSEELSKDLAKMLPFTLLGIFIVDTTYFSLTDSFNAVFVAFNITTFNLLVYYLIFIVVLEFVMRVLHSLKKKILG